jgi:hypothetical protein
MENIIRYVNGHQDAQLAAIAASEAGFGMLEDIQKKLCFAGNELQRREAPLSMMNRPQNWIHISRQVSASKKFCF